MRYAQLTMDEIKQYLNEETPVILPMGAVEVHGPHLPLETDNLLAERYADLLAEKIGALVLPVLPYGQVWSLRNFPGSLTVSDETMAAFLFEMGESVYQQGTRMVIFFSAHLGNMAAMKTAGRRLYDAYPDIKMLYLFYPNLLKFAQDIREGKSAHHTYVHAEEVETSLMLYLAPEAVDMDKAIDDPPEIPLSADFTPTPWETFTESAVLGEATLASKEKGQYLVEKTLEQAVRLIEQLKE
ncbi:creatininase family protein [Atopococcus tabaci]|uniref:creatininase family protein n=1 Tax=Atopococcus tabaci TaxID=269774 RepID=UPI0004156EDA|nr:creatininase family protein [Atopococcus tabaci]